MLDLRPPVVGAPRASDRPDRNAPTAERLVPARRAAARILSLLLRHVPSLGLVLASLGWLTYGIDLPSQDDWRGYRSGEMGSFDLGYLFRSTNDTAYPVGKALDSLAFRVLDGNGIAYQFITQLLCLGGLLAIQYLILRSLTGSRALLVASYGLTILTVQPNSYWGIPNLAYHQAVPLLALLIMLHLVIGAEVRMRWMAAGLAGLATISGLIYISGAFGDATLLAIFAVAGWWYDGLVGRRFTVAATALAVPTLVSLAVQLRVILLVQGGTHRETVPMALPDEADFWMYALGKVGRSLLLPADRPLVALAVTALALAAVAAVVALTLPSLLARRGRSMAELRPGLVLVAVPAILLSYLMLVAAGRANLRPPDRNGHLEVFAFGFGRFHYFWLTVLWPPVFLVGWRLLQRRSPRPGSAARGPLLTAGALLALFLLGGALDHFAYYRSVAGVRLEQLGCIADTQRDDSEGCAGSLTVIDESAIRYARLQEATFTRTLPVASSTPAAVLRPIRTFEGDLLGQVRVNNGTATLVPAGPESPARLEVEGERDVQLVVDVGRPVLMGWCGRAVVELHTSSTPVDEVAEAFYRRPEDERFAQARSVPLARHPGPEGDEILRFAIDSPAGLGDRVRVDPVKEPAAFTVTSLAVSCAD